jgi:hypothetical protein
MVFFFWVVLACEQRTTPGALCITGDIRVQIVSGLPPYDRPTIMFSRVALKPDDPPGKKKKRTKGGIARTLANTNNKTQAPLSPELCNATTSNLLHPFLSLFLNLTSSENRSSLTLICKRV